MVIFRRLTFVTAILALFAVVGIANTTDTAKAISGSDFNAGNIIQDRNFYNNQSMSAAEIQAFLNSKVPNCQTGYTCLKNYSQSTPDKPADSAGYCGNYAGGTKVAAQIIYDVGLVCGINPQVILTLLQKEEVLVTDDSPIDIQYRSATGYGCPDTAACDSTYYGFFNQVYKAAWQYKYYQANVNSFSYRPFRNNTILWNPSTSCGSSTVFIENQATAGLYNYTPYRPNQAALNNLYGLGDSCSSYGNRNFWRIFSDWFGIDNKPLIRTSTSTDLYYTVGQYKWKVTSMDVAAEYGFGVNDVAFVSQQTMDSIPNPPNGTYGSLNYFAKSDSDSDEDGGNIYLVSGRTRYLVTSMQQFADFGLDINSLPLLPYYALVRLPLVGNLSSFVTSNSGFVYKVSGGSKQGIFQNDYYNSLNPSGQTSRLSDFILTNTISTGQPLINGALTLQDTSGKLWETSSSGWNYIPSMNIASCLGVDNNIIPVTPQQAPLGTQLSDSSCVAKSQSSSTVYLLDKNKKYPQQSAWGLSSPVVVDDSLLTGKQTVTASSGVLVKSPTDSTVFTIQNGNKRHISDGVALGEVDPAQTILSTASSVLATLPSGPERYSSGTLLADPSGSLYVINNDQRYYVPSMDLFFAYGFSTNKIIRVGSSDINSYASGGTLAQKVVLNTNSVIFDKAIGWQVPASLTTDYGFSSPPSYLPAMGRYAVAKQATRYVKSSDSAQLYYIEGGTKRPVYSWGAWTTLGGTNDNITTFSPYTISQFPTGASY